MASWACHQTEASPTASTLRRSAVLYVRPQLDRRGRPRTRLGLTNQGREQEPLDANFLPTAYDGFPFQPAPTTQGSPDPIAAATPMPVGSVDSGLGPEMEDSNRASRTRSSSEEKESTMTPAQSRRKAQNRAA